MVELRKRKHRAEPDAPRPSKKANSVKSSASSKTGESSANGHAVSRKVVVGDAIVPEDFGGEIETNGGEKVTLKRLIDQSANGVVIFTYPKASTPGCEFSPDIVSQNIYTRSSSNLQLSLVSKTRG